MILSISLFCYLSLIKTEMMAFSNVKSCYILYFSLVIHQNRFTIISVIIVTIIVIKLREEK